MWYIVWRTSITRVKKWMCVSADDVELARSMARDVDGRAVWINHAKVQDGCNTSIGGTER